jgi:hypothetical protein
VFRPQFARPPACPGFIWQPCVYQFDSTNTPAFAQIALASGDESGYIPLPLDKDAPFVLMAIKIQQSTVNVQIWDPDGNELMDDYVSSPEYATDLCPFTVLEGPGVECPKGSVFQVRLQGQ